MASFQYKANLPSDIQQKVNLLLETQIQVSTLESLIQKSRTNYELLETELIPYRLNVGSAHSEAAALGSDMVLDTPSTGIQALPDEILLYVFENVLSWRHRRIGVLLKVCKRWHSIVTQSPTLWTRIKISPVEYEDYGLSNHHSSVTYVEACLKYSRSSLLDVEIDYVELRSREGHIRERIENAVLNIADRDQEYEVFDWARGVICDLPSSEYDAYTTDMLNVLDALIGPEGAHMERWRSINLRVPWSESQPAFDIWVKFVGRTPNLKHASFSNISGAFEGEDNMGRLDLCFPTLSDLRSLTLDHRENFLLNVLTISPLSLHHLDIYYSAYVRFMSQVSEFPRLRTLALRNKTQGKTRVKASQHTDAPLIVRLHEVHELRLWGNSHLVQHVQFDLPNLQELLLDTMYGFCVPSGLTPARIRWKVLNPHDAYWTPDTIRESLLGMLQMSNRIEMMTVYQSVLPPVSDVFSDIKRTKSLPASLESVVIELVGGEKDIITLP